MATTTRGAATVEKHPIFHDLYVYTDEIVKRNRKMPTIIKREEHCYHCPTRRFTRIDVLTWTQIGSRQYKYDRRVTIERVSKQEFLKSEFLKTTTLVGTDIDALR